MLIAIWQSNSKFVSNLQVREVIMYVSFGVVDGFRSQESNLMFLTRIYGELIPGGASIKSMVCPWLA
jgi:hypothetical protein